jgi:FkbM family methyltransferase
MDEVLNKDKPSFRYYSLVRNVANWPLVLRLKLLGSIDAIIRFDLCNGVRIDLPRGILHDFKMIVMTEVYSHRMPLPLPARPTILDIGANVGSFSAFAAARYSDARIVAFEPDPRNFMMLEHNSNLNPGRFEIVNAAVSDRSGEGIFIGGDSDRHTTGGHLVTQASGAHQKVEVISLTDAFSRFAIGRCDLLKLDCEGAEFGIVYNSPDDVLARISQMVIEVHRGVAPGHSQADLAYFLNRKGFATRSNGGDLLWAWRATV